MSKNNPLVKTDLNNLSQTMKDIAQIFEAVDDHGKVLIKKSEQETPEKARTIYDDGYNPITVKTPLPFVPVNRKS